MPKPNDEAISDEAIKRAIIYFYTCPKCGKDWALDVMWDDKGLPHCDCKFCDWTNEVDLEAHRSEWDGEDDEEEGPEEEELNER